MAILDWSHELPTIGLVQLVPLLFLAVILYSIVDSYAAGLGHIPGPFFARFTDLDGLLRKWKFTVDENWIMPLHEKYGDVVRIGPRCVSVADPAAIRTIYSTKSRLEKSHRWKVFKPSGINEPYGTMRDMAAHGAHRKLVAGAYANSSLHRYEHSVDRSIHDLFGKLESQRASATDELDIALWAKYYAYDVIGGVTFGGPIGFLHKGRDVRYLITTQVMMTYYFRTLVQLPVLGFIGISGSLFGLLGLNKKLSFYAYAEEQMKKRFDDTGACVDRGDLSDMLSFFLSTQEKNPEVMTNDEVMTNCFVNMAAGTLSQSKVLEKILHFLIRTPLAQDNVHEELKARDLQVPVSNADAQALPYLSSIVREALRLHHSGIGMIGGRDTPPEGMMLPNGVHIPGAVEVGMELHVLGCREDTYGERPHEYRPERWLQRPGEEQEAYQARKTAMEHTDMSFGYGATACAGRNVAMMTIHKLLANLILTYKLLPTRGTESDDSDPAYCRLERRIAD